MAYYTQDNKGHITAWSDHCFDNDCLYTDAEIVRGSDGQGYIAGTEPGLTSEQIQTMIIAGIDNYMNKFASTRGYDSMASAASYAGDEDPIFNLEGTYAKQMRSEIYRVAYTIINNDILGTDKSVQIPTIEEIIAKLPPLIWPNPTSY